MKRLTAKDRLFCFEYLADEKLNPERAAIKVGYSPKVARNKAYVWVSNSQQNPKPQIKAFIDEQVKKRQETLDITIEKVIKEFAKIAFSNVVEIIEKMGGHINIKLLKELSEDQKAAIAEINEYEIDGVTTRKIKMHDKNKALENIAKRLKPQEEFGLVIKVITDGELVSVKKLNGQ